MPTMDDIIKQVHDLPSLPAVVAELLTTVEQDEVDLHALAGKIALDQSLTAKTLRLANSSFYGMPTKVTTIGQAIAVLGFHSIRTLVTACAVTGAFRPGAASRFAFEPFWRHAIGTAVCARALARHARLSPETAFTAGLLHDLGTLVLATRYPAEYDAVEAYRRQHDCGPGVAQHAIFGYDHARVGSALAAHWKFPPAIQDAVSGHHHPDGPDGMSLALLIHVADVLAHALDLGGEEDDQVPPLSQQSWRMLALSDAACMAIFAETEATFQDLCQILVH
ncbi:HDOD domain-containing protein [Duganella sp. LX20W]|uniref:HDOD domain-containing protein n=1 Tax=Rugamonas brunnea TaxID=2758569 RepID=A0A7W2IAM4_9BURK|nr:HDOD domain-containing protein [Rugamonas brunnea]MBA5636027.1 HDOD domain-containing protein [Rugamonas brunnea]